MHRHLFLFSLITILPIVSTAKADIGNSTDGIHDGHIHYDQDVWDTLSPREAIQLLTDQNIKRALVSSTPTQGAEMLYRENPEAL